MVAHKKAVTGIVNINEWLRHNVHIIILSIPLLLGTGRMMGFEWSGSPQAIINHVDKADAKLLAQLSEQHQEDQRLDSTTTAALHALTDTMIIVQNRQAVVLSVICQQLTRDQRALIENVIRCTPYYQTRTNTVPRSINPNP